MRLKWPTLLARFLLVWVIFFNAGCHRELPVEEKLLHVFQRKLAALKSYENRPYASYMRSENKSFARDRKDVNELITEINIKYDKIPEKRRKSYEKKWQRKFQPVVDEILRRTHGLVVRETSTLTSKKMAEIEKLSIQRKAMEKNLPEEKLKPVFFILPEE